MLLPSDNTHTCCTEMEVTMILIAGSKLTLSKHLRRNRKSTIRFESLEREVQRELRFERAK